VNEQSTPLPPRDEITDDGVFKVVADSYEAVYAELTASDTFNRLWRTNAYQNDFPLEFAHIGFLTTREARQVLKTLGLTSESILVDLACGGCGPGLWMAEETGASLVGVDPAAAGLALAAARARQVGLDGRATFRRGTFTATGLANAAADAVISIEAFQYAPDKSAALSEIHRVLCPGGRVALIAFEVDPTRVTDIPVLGVDPVPDYRPLLEAAGFELTAYEETPGWEDRVYGAFQAIVDSAEQLTAEMGEVAAGGAITEATLTLSLRPYPRRVLACALRDDCS
jgi:SAM-dependent methyltransferase